MSTPSLRDLPLRWKGFLRVVFDPWTLVLLIATVVLVYGSYAQDNKKLAAILSVLASLCSALLGGIVTKEWLDLAETKVLVARGRTAIRNLKLLLNSIGALERRVVAYLRRLPREECSQEVIRTYMEEVVEKCRMLQEEAINSVENWTDIIPEADVKTQIGRISELQTQVTEKSEEIGKLKTDLSSTKDASDKEKEDLRKTIQSKEAELQKTKKELREKQNDLGGIYGIRTLGESTSLGQLGAIGRLKTCKQCGLVFTSSAVSAADLAKERCPYCNGPQ